MSQLLERYSAACSANSLDRSLTVRDALLTLLDRAASEPEFLDVLLANIIETAVSENLRLSLNDFKQVMGVAGATDEEFLEMVRQRLTPTVKCCGCGG